MSGRTLRSYNALPDTVYSHPLEVVHFHRKPRALLNHSVEGHFRSVRAALPHEIEVRIEQCRFVSKGVLRRIWLVFEAALRRGEVNHITGDVHFLAFSVPAGRTILTILDCGFETQPRTLRTRLLNLLWFQMPVRRARLVTVISEFTRQRLLAHVQCAPEKIRVIPVCVSTTFTRSEKVFNESRPVILQVGTAVNKNLLRLCEALEGIRCRLHIVGPLSVEQKDALNRRGIDYQADAGLTEDELVKAYETCDMVVFASTYEGFGMPIVEANIVGRPVVTSNVASMPEVAGDAACLVDPYSIESIRAGVARVIRDAEYRKQLIARGFENAKRFSPSRVAALYAALYREVGGGTCREI